MNEVKTLAYVFDAYGTLFDVHAAIAPPSRRGRS